MAIFKEAFERQKKEAGKEREDVITLADIRSDKRKSALMGAILDREGQSDMGERMLKNELTMEDIDDLDSYRKELQDVLKETEEARESLTPEMIDMIAKNDKNFEKIVNMAGSDRVVEAVGSQLELLRIYDEHKFFQIKLEMGGLKAEEEALEEKDKEVKELCEEYGISTKELGKIMDIEDDRERRVAIENMVKDTVRDEDIKAEIGWKIFGRRKKIEERKKVKIEERIKKLDKKKDINDAMEDINDQIKKVGRALLGTLNDPDNKNIRKAFETVLQGEKIEKSAIESARSFSEARRIMAADRDETDDDFDTEWQTERARVNFDGLNDNGKEDARNQFINSQKGRMGKEKGFWAWLARQLRIENKKSSLI